MPDVYIKIHENIGVFRTGIIDDNVLIDYDDAGRVVGIEILGALEIKIEEDLSRSTLFTPSGDATGSQDTN